MSLLSYSLHIIVDPEDYERLSADNGDLFSADITATNSRACIEVSIINDNLPGEGTEHFLVEVVPDPFYHPNGLPANFLLRPTHIIVRINDTL